MINKARILFSMPTRHHIEIAADEMDGMTELGYPCGRFPYGAQEGASSAPARLKVIIQNALNLVKTAKKFKPDIIYLNSRLEVIAGVRDMLTIFIFNRLYGNNIKFIIKSHGSDIGILNSKSYLTGKIVLPYLKKNVSAWLFLSTEEKTKVIQTGYFDPQKLFVTKNIVRSDQFIPDSNFKQRLNIATDKTILLFVGRIIKEKGIYQVVEAFAQVKERARLILIIVGSGPELDNIKHQCDLLGISDQVIFTGFIPEQEVVPFYANCDVLIFPTYFPEGFPMALFNSVSAGMAVITTPTRAATDFLSEPQNCLWVEPENSSDVKKQLEKLLRSDLLIKNMRLNNKAKGKLFTRQQVCVELAGVIEKIIS